MTQKTDEEILKQAEQDVFIDNNVAEDNTEYQHYIDEDNWLSTKIIKKAIYLTRQSERQRLKAEVEKITMPILLNIADLVGDLRAKIEYKQLGKVEHLDWIINQLEELKKRLFGEE